MSDYSETGAQPVVDAAVEDPPTEDEVREAQEREHPDQAATRDEGPRPTTADPGDDQGRRSP
jgi:hypothetical protein